MKKYEQIETWIRSAILESRFLPGDRLPSESELCRRFAVSRSSVRLALKNLIHDGWVESRKGVGSFALMKSRTPTKNIGFVCYYSTSYIFPQIVQGCDQVLFRAGFHLLLSQSEYDLNKERSILESLRRKAVDGVIIEPVFGGSEPSNRDLLLDIQREGIPVVLIDNYFPQSDFSYIALDDVSGGRLAASYLWSRGHRKIGIFFKESYFPSQLRRDGAVAFLNEKGVPVRRQWMFPFKGQEPKGAAYRAAGDFLQNVDELPSALICGNDEESLQLIRAAEERGIEVPRDLSIISFDNSELARINRIPLTSVDHPDEYMGRKAAGMLLEQIVDAEIGSRTVSLVPPKIIERQSVVDLAGVAE